MGMIKFLIVDDEIEVVSFLNNFLKRKGIKVFTAINGKDALDVFTQEKPEFVLLDINIPGEDGFSILKTIKDLSGQTKVIMITARDDKVSVAKAKRMGAEDYIIKPMELEDLDRIISKHLT